MLQLGNRPIFFIIAQEEVAIAQEEVADCSGCGARNGSTAMERDWSGRSGIETVISGMEPRRIAEVYATPAYDTLGQNQFSDTLVSISQCEVGVRNVGAT